jgi:hypothetical protein
MSKKTSGPLRIAPLQRVIAEPITDLAEQVALDRLRKREKGKHGEQKAKLTRDSAKTISSTPTKRRG